MRVLLISHTCQSRTEGQPKAVALAECDGVELCVVTPRRWMHYGAWRESEAPDPGARFEFRAEHARLPWVGPAQCYLHHYPALGSILREFQPDVIDLWEEPWAAVSAQAVRLRDRLAPRAKIVTETEQNIDKRLPFPFESFRRYTLRHADFAVGRNRAAVEILRAKGYRGPAAVVPNAVDAELFRPMDREACRRQLVCDGFVVGYMGRLVPEKGLRDLVDAVAATNCEAKLLLVGSGPMENELRERARERGLGGRFKILPAKPLAELPAVMNAIDVLALPSRTTPRWREQFGRVLIEASACGTPVIGSDSGAIPDVIADSGLVFTEGDSAALASSIDRLAANPALRRALGETGRRRVEEHFTWRRVAERMSRIYRLIHGNAASTHVDPLADSAYHGRNEAAAVVSAS